MPKGHILWDLRLFNNVCHTGLIMICFRVYIFIDFYLILLQFKFTWKRLNGAIERGLKCVCVIDL